MQQDPEWWTKALKLELANRLKEAEQAIHKGESSIGSVIQTAELYRLRMERLKQEGDLKGAREARAKAVEWAISYASCATSGGEGVALSMERDQFIASLGTI